MAGWIFRSVAAEDMPKTFKRGDHVEWNSEAGRVRGTVVKKVVSDVKFKGYTPDACVTYQTLYRALEAFERDLHEHIHLENNILFPRSVDLEAAAF